MVELRKSQSGDKKISHSGEEGIPSASGPDTSDRLAAMNINDDQDSDDDSTDGEEEEEEEEEA